MILLAVPDTDFSVQEIAFSFDANHGFKVADGSGSESQAALSIPAPAHQTGPNHRMKSIGPKINRSK
jgi:hypothetical protein